ncbi:LysR family transcriptional regulator [Rhizobium sullae]|uniref:HTH-type transcriptional regulator TtuA n=1 Tax=Rhizobium sullae TaxID=50338 RepID=A0A4R3Q6D5_RHISU|nr:LysR family transcriptional regulator [Rhizobium sullae]TCU14832.1 LysR family transcriptional regulator [Rhizobium sullae]
MVDRLSGISVFVQAAGAGSFARAGDQLGLTRSAVGKAIARLEDRLETRLFNRTTRGQSLTDRGQDFYERCLRIMAEVDAAEAVLDTDDGSPSGLLRVSAPVLLGRQCVAPILVALAKRHPKLELDLRFSDHFVDIVEDRIDLAVRIGPLPDRSGLLSRTLGTFDQMLCAAPSYIASRGCPLTIDDLLEHECLLYSRRGGRIEPWRFKLGDGNAAELSPVGRLRFDDLDAIANAAVDGVGIACLPRWLVRTRIESGKLLAVLGSHRALGNDVHAVRPQTPHVLSKVRFAVEELAKKMPQSLQCPNL